MSAKQPSILENLETKDIAILDLLLSHMPYYGGFSLWALKQKIPQEQVAVVIEESDNADGHLLKVRRFLLEHGYAIRRKDIHPMNIELKERGRWLKEQGTYREY